MSQSPSQNPATRPATEILGPSKDPVLNEDNPFEAMMERFDRAAQILDLDPGLYQVLRHPETQIIVAVPIQRDDRILEEQGTFVMPDILANAGGVTPTLNERLQAILRRSFHDVLSVAHHHKVNMRTAAYMLAMERVAAVHRLRGMYA